MSKTGMIKGLHSTKQMNNKYKELICKYEIFLVIFCVVLLDIGMQDFKFNNQKAFSWGTGCVSFIYINSACIDILKEQVVSNKLHIYFVLIALVGGHESDDTGLNSLGK